MQLVPRLKNWTATYYPGTTVGITEYNWGAEGHINGATAQADILGIFGREGLALATRWTTPNPSTPTYQAIKMYRNYDNYGSGFGDVSVSASVPNPDNLAVFAAQRSSDLALTIMAVNKVLSGSTAVNLRLANFTAGGPAQVWQLTSSAVIARLADAAVSGSTLAVTLPPQSITLFVIPSTVGSANIAATAGTPQSTTVNTGFTTALQATVRDAASNLVSGTTVTFTAPSGGPGTTFNGSLTATVVTNASGVATAPPLTANSQAGNYSVTASAAGIATPASFALTNNALTSSLTVQVSTNQASYWRNQTVLITAKVWAGSSVVSGARVAFTITKPGGSVVTGTVTTGASGSASYAMRVKGKDPVGTYRVSAIASLNGVSGSGETSFTVK